MKLKTVLNMMMGAALLVLPLFTSAQRGPEPAALLRQLSRLELELIQKNLRYHTRTMGMHPVLQREERRLDLVKATAHTESELAGLAAHPGQRPQLATARHLAARLLALQQTDYKHVNDVSVYKENSVVARRAYFTAVGEAMQQSTVLLDSLDAARIALADAENIRPDLNHQLELWLRAAHRITQLYRDHTAIVGVFYEVAEPIKAEFVALSERNASEFEKARRQLLDVTQAMLGNLKTGNDLDGDDSSLREAGRDFVLGQQEAAKGLLATIGGQLKRLDQLNPDEMKQLNELIQEYRLLVQEGEKNFQKAVSTFLIRNSPNMDSY